jgi:hypothetical protein
VEGLHDRLLTVTGADFYVASGLLTILRDAERSLLVSRTGVLLLLAQLSILAGYAIILTASLLVDHRRVDTALLRSRGAGPRQVALLALAEGLLLALPAVLIAPWLAVAALNLLNVAGPLAGGPRIVPRVTLEAYRPPAPPDSSPWPARPARRTLGARVRRRAGGLSRLRTARRATDGLDIALLAVTGIAIWQLALLRRAVDQTVGAAGSTTVVAA